ncbi:S1 family peptidase [Corynebacterium camporealensis]
MLRLSHLKKVLVGSAFAGAFFFGAPAAGADELPTPNFDSAGFVDQVRSDLADFGIQTPEVDTAVTDAVDSALENAVPQAPAQQPAEQPAEQPAPQVAPAVEQAASQVQQAADAAAEYAQPATNPNPIGLLEEATQPDWKPLGNDPYYQWKNDMFSKVAAGKPEAEFILHRVPGSFFDAPRIPDESDVAMTQDNSLYGPGTPLYIGEDSFCTLTVAGNDAEGRKVGLTAAHCGQVGDSVTSADSWQVGPTGTIVDRNEYLDYSVIEFGSQAEVTRSYNGVHANKLGGDVRPGELTCKRGVATGTTCGMTYVQGQELQANQVCAMQGDSGAPLFSRGRLVGSITGGVIGNFACHSPLQGAVHAPTMATNMDAILADLNRRGGVGAGFHLPE